MNLCFILRFIFVFVLHFFEAQIDKIGKIYHEGQERSGKSGFMLHFFEAVKQK